MLVSPSQFAALTSRTTLFAIVVVTAVFFVFSYHGPRIPQIPQMPFRLLPTPNNGTQSTQNTQNTQHQPDPVALPNVTVTNATAPVTDDAVSAALISWWKDLASVLEYARPACPPVVVDYKHDHDFKTFEPAKPDLVKPHMLVNFTDADEAALFKAHYTMRNQARRLGAALPFNEGTTGIVTTAGGSYIPITLVTLRLLRRTGCELPVEVFIDGPSEYNATICEDVFPSLNARCRMISEVYDTAENVNITPPDKYQFKILSIMYSSFQHVLFLDADCFPAHDPTPLFSAPPYTTHGLVTWPDFWASTASMHYYHIAGIPEVPASTSYATESGQLMIDKARHRGSLMMMAYYNYHGPDYYYLLLSQGGPGAGDKDTFVPAAQVMDEPYYQVKQKIGIIGRFGRKKEKDMAVAAMTQADPIADYAYKAPHNSHIHDKAEWRKEDLVDVPVPAGADRKIDQTIPPKPKPIFVHTAMHKLDPAKIMEPGGVTFKYDGTPVRFYTSDDDGKSNIETFGYDLERRVFEALSEEACRTDEELCRRIQVHFDTVIDGNKNDKKDDQKDNNSGDR